MRTAIPLRVIFRGTIRFRRLAGSSSPARLAETAARSTGRMEPTGRVATTAAAGVAGAGPTSPAPGMRMEIAPAPVPFTRVAAISICKTNRARARPATSTAVRSRPTGRVPLSVEPSHKAAIASTGTTEPTGSDSASTERAAIATHRSSPMRFIDREEVARRLTYEVCIPLVRDAMIVFSAGETRQLLRSIIPLADGHLFGIMPGALGANAPFGAKLISIFPENAAQGMQSHQGLIVLFEPDIGAPVCAVHAGEVTAIRTAAASAVATDALALSNAKHLAILGTGEQAATHARAISRVRSLESITIWGRTPDRAYTLADQLQAEFALPVTAVATVEQAAATADILCTVTACSEPILKGEWVRPGTHINAVGSSHAGHVEIDNAVVARALFLADSREVL